jgi:hypothetical protein
MWENKNSYDFDGRQAGISCLRWSAGSKTGFKKGVEFAVGVFQCAYCRGFVPDEERDNYPENDN